jgi:hypothetical protein
MVLPAAQSSVAVPTQVVPLNTRRCSSEGLF